MVEKRQKVFAQTTERLNNARKNGPALSTRITGFLVKFAKIRGAAGLGKGTLGVPLGQRITNGGINKKFLTGRCNGQDVHYSVSEVLCLKWIEIISIVCVCWRAD